MALSYLLQVGITLAPISRNLSVLLNSTPLAAVQCAAITHEEKFREKQEDGRTPGLEKWPKNGRTTRTQQKIPRLFSFGTP